MKYTLRTAAKAVGKSRTTIHRAIKRGIISADKDHNGKYRIDPSELHRIFEPVTQEEQEETLHDDDKEQCDTDGNWLLLREKIDRMAMERERERRQLEETIKDLRERLDAEAQERRRLTLILTGNQEKKGFLRRLLGWS